MRTLSVLLRVGVLLGSLGVASACGRQAVRASEKQFLADQVMIFDDDPHHASTNDHIRSNREGAAGGQGAGGGGCGCN